MATGGSFEAAALLSAAAVILSSATSSSTLASAFVAPVSLPPRKDRPGMAARPKDSRGGAAGSRLAMSSAVDEEGRTATEDELKAAEILREIDEGIRVYPKWVEEDFGEPLLDPTAVADDDPDAIDPFTLGKWDASDLDDKFDYEFDLEKGDDDPNDLDPNVEHLTKPEIDDDGVEVGYDPIFGRSNPFDSRTIVGTYDSYVVADDSRDDRIITPDFPQGDLEVDLTKKVRNFRRSLKIIETHVDPHLEEEVPKNVQKWHGYPEQMKYPEKDFANNRFTKPKDRTDFSGMTPHRARKTAVQLARAKNNEWLPEGASAKFHYDDTKNFRKHDLLVGSFREGPKDPEIVEAIRPALDVLGSVAKLLSIQDGVFRFHYHGLIKNKAGMAAWTSTLIEDCGVECTGVVFETGKRKRDPYYDGGDHWFGPY